VQHSLAQHVSKTQLNRKRRANYSRFQKKYTGFDVVLELRFGLPLFDEESLPAPHFALGIGTVTV
jgi:hypothetical protein